MKKITFLLFAIFLFGCGEKKIDASTEQNLFQSINTIKLSLTKESDVKDIDAFLEILVERNDPLFLNYHPEIKLADLHGMNADQLLVYYHRYLIAVEEKKKDVARLKEQDLEARERKELAELLAEFDAAKNNADKISIKYVGAKGTNSYSDVYIDIKNDFNVSIKMVSYFYEYKTEGRSLPWFSGDKLSILSDGGLEPGETRRDVFTVLNKNVVKLSQDHPEARFRFYVKSFVTYDGKNVYAYLDDDRLFRLNYLMDKYANSED